MFIVDRGKYVVILFVIFKCGVVRFIEIGIWLFIRIGCIYYYFLLEYDINYELVLLCFIFYFIVRRNFMVIVFFVFYY